MKTNHLQYKQYRGFVEYSSEDEVFYGTIHGINDLVTFEGESVKELQASFEEAVDDYLATCLKLGKEPQREFKGQFNVRVSKKVHQAAALKAAELKISLNRFVEIALEKAVLTNK